MIYYWTHFIFYWWTHIFYLVIIYYSYLFCCSDYASLGFIRSASVSLYRPSSFCFLDTSLLSGTTGWIFQTHLVFSLPQHRISQFSPRSPASFHWIMVFRHQDLAMSVLVATQVSLIPGLPSGWSWKIHVCILNHVYTHNYVSVSYHLSICIHTCIYRKLKVHILSFLTLTQHHIHSSLPPLLLELLSLTMRNLALNIYHLVTYLFNPSIYL